MEGIEHALDAIIVGIDQRIVEDYRRWTPVTREQTRKRQARKNGKLFAHPAAQSIDILFQAGADDGPHRGNRAGLAARTALTTLVAEAVPDFGWLALDDSGLATDCGVEDMDRIDRAGALREAADTLLAESGDGNRSAAERTVAAALALLYGHAQAVA